MLYYSFVKLSMFIINEINSIKNTTLSTHHEIWHIWLNLETIIDVSYIGTPDEYKVSHKNVYIQFANRANEFYLWWTGIMSTRNDELGETFRRRLPRNYINLFKFFEKNIFKYLCNRCVNLLFKGAFWGVTGYALAPFFAKLKMAPLLLLLTIFYKYRKHTWKSSTISTVRKNSYWTWYFRRSATSSVKA